ncbi:MAG: recombinase family protein [Gammaproteobacteria bacterium]|nr:recombinase family protein [Gammaproteobacteria bacterium]
MAGSRRVARLKERGQAVVEARAEIASRAAGYIRVSTEEQAAHGFGLEAQERAIRAFADSQGYDLVKVVADPAVSGATRPAERPGFNELLDLAQDGEISLLLVWKFDRLARQIVYSVVTANELAECGVAVRSVTEPIDTSTPMGRTIFAVLAGMAEQERQAITERTWGGRRAKAVSGGFAGGAAPYGYRKDKDGGLLIEPTEAAAVRRIYELRQTGQSYPAIARTLNALAIKPPRGSQWRHSTVAYILDNPKYKGEIEYLFRWGGAEQHVLQRGAHAPIIDSEPRI